ncbi:Crp/Fnr family transcriptional regulator [Reinekea sp.]|jgi:CRP/FNR family cyclic AMP-dependent transcriptional regulator|uniref:Crp/Fnr family transcriptional regulator n=1 Tax=Reinekea sp. TaxID=1970455 RepID=UPI003989DE20
MFTLVKHPENWIKGVIKQQEFALEQFKQAQPEQLSINRNDLADQGIEEWALVRVVKGVMGLMVEGNRLFALEAGDCWLAYPGGFLDWYQEGALELELWPWLGVTQKVTPEIIHGFNDLMLELNNHNTVVPPDPMPGFDFFRSGDVIIREGEPADAVYTLIQGRAKVMIDGRQVGEVKENEIIGLQAMLLKTNRTATVIAVGPCSAVRVQYDKFRLLIQTRPELVISTLESMALQISRANQRITKPE